MLGASYFTEVAAISSASYILTYYLYKFKSGHYAEHKDFQPVTL